MESGGHFKGLGLPQTSKPIDTRRVSFSELTALRICGPFALDLALSVGVLVPLGPGTDIQVGWTDSKSVSVTVAEDGGFH